MSNNNGLAQLWLLNNVKFQRFQISFNVSYEKGVYLKFLFFNTLSSWLLFKLKNIYIAPVMRQSAL